MLNGLSLFTGIGGIDVALSDWVRPICYCEIEPYCQSVLLSRMQEGDLPKAPIWDDVRTLRTAFGRIPIEMGNQYSAHECDIIYGGFPCQDISIAGAGKGLEGERSGLFFEILRLAKEIKPTFIFLENVPAITGRGGLRVVKEIASLGYDCRWCVISAASVGALHRRERWFLLAHSKHNGTSTSEEGEGLRESFASGREYESAKGIREIERTGSLSRDVANTTSQSPDGHTQREEKEYSMFRKCSKNGGDTDSITSKQANKRIVSDFKNDEKREYGCQEYSRRYWPFESQEHWQETVSGICRTSDGVPNQVDRLKALGNAVVPIQCREAFKILMGLNGAEVTED